MRVYGHFLWGIASTVALAVGSLGAWVAGSLSIAGTDFDRYGYITLGIAVIACMLVTLRLPRLVAAVPAGGALVFGTVAFVRVLRVPRDIERSVAPLGALPGPHLADIGQFAVSPGWGLILVELAAVSLLVWAFITPADVDERATSADGTEPVR